MSELRKKMIRAMQLKDFSPKTQESYLAAVKGLARYCKKSPDILTKEEVEDYLLYLKKDGKSTSTRNVVICGLKFLYEKTLKNDDIFLNFPERRRPKILPEVLSMAEVEKILDAPGNLKHRVILMTTYSAGLRLSEVASLKVNHIDSDRMQIRIEQGKGCKDRYTILSKTLLEELRVYYKSYRPTDWLFYSKKRDTPISRVSIQRIYKNAKAKADITKGRGIHTLRHCFATHLLEAGCDLRKIQMLMGHRSLSTTMVYLHVCNSALSKIISPLDHMQTTQDQTAPWERGS